VGTTTLYLIPQTKLKIKEASLCFPFRTPLVRDYHRKLYPADLQKASCRKCAFHERSEDVLGYGNRSCIKILVFHFAKFAVFELTLIRVTPVL
jgi:hypothetical protein